MKGSIVKCLSELVKNNFGEHKWKDIMQISGQNPNMLIKAISDVDDATFFNIFENTCKVLDITRQQACDAFGEYFINTFAPKIYGSFYTQFKTAKQFIMGMDKVHDTVTNIVQNAHPPRFTIEEVDKNTITVNYISHRNMIDLYMGLTRGVGKYFNTTIDIKKISDEKVELTFSDSNELQS